MTRRQPTHTRHLSPIELPSALWDILTPAVRAVSFEDARNTAWWQDENGEALDEDKCESPLPAAPDGWNWLGIGGGDRFHHVLENGMDGGNGDGTYHTISFHRGLIVVWKHSFQNPVALERCDIPRAAPV